MIPKLPSIAVQAMIDGIDHALTLPNFRINMTTYLERKGKICYGCAATCAVLNLVGFDYLNKKQIPVGFTMLSEEFEDLKKWNGFEGAIDDLRLGDIVCFFEYFDIYLSYEQLDEFSEGMVIMKDKVSRSKWEKKFKPYYLELITKLKKHRM